MSAQRHDLVRTLANGIEGEAGAHKHLLVGGLSLRDEVRSKICGTGAPRTLRIFSAGARLTMRFFGLLASETLRR